MVDELFDLVFDSSAEMAWVICNEQVVYANRSTQQAWLSYGWQVQVGDPADTLEKNFMVDSWPDSSEKYFCIRIKTGERTVWLKTSKTPIHYKGHNCQLWLARDKTEEVTALHALAESNAKNERLLAEVHHRVRNNLSVLLGLMQLQVAYMDDAPPAQVFTNYQLRIRCMALVHDHLSHLGELSCLTIPTFLKHYGRLLSNFYVQQPQVNMLIEAEECQLDLARSVPFALVLNELVQYAFENTFKAAQGGTIKVQLEELDQNLILTVSDNGPSQAPEFSIEQARSLGFMLIRELVRQLKASISYDGSMGNRFTVSLLAVG